MKARYGSFRSRDMDSCACCAPHVKETGSVGLIKIVGAVHYKGGMRVSILCGFRALEDYRMKERNVTRYPISFLRNRRIRSGGGTSGAGAEPSEGEE